MPRPLSTSYRACALSIAWILPSDPPFLGMLDRTMGSFNLAQFSAQVGPVVQQAQAGGKEVVDYAFWKGILLVVIVLVAALIYRFLVTRLLLPGKNQD
jgi:hypothetical protein